ncbi:MAG TPA: carboxypeptidase-like regulatory domain-containing protein [Anaeromyxobacteraceae bacterium]|nr:carboxypeptidase-like regulatory domain-containing protein [Anaeromyxobacteraceae bacterium]
MHPLASVLLLLAPLAPAAAPPVPGIPGELRGSVTRAADGQPVTRFTVNGIRFEDSRGAFKILVPPEGEFRIVIRADGYAPNVIHVMGAAGKKLVMPEITLGGGEDVLGEVLDASTGLPVVNARVGLADPSKVERLRFVRPERVGDLAATGSGGWFHIRKAPRGLLMLVVSHPDYLPAFVPVNTRGRIPTVEMQRPGRIEGVVRDERGRPAGGARVVAVSAGSIDGAEAVTDPRGGFQISGLRPGAYEISVVRPGARAGDQRSRVLVAYGASAHVDLDAGPPERRMALPEFQLGEF